MTSEKDCPPDMEEAFCTLIWAANRVDGIPELAEIAKQLKLKYGPPPPRLPSQSPVPAATDDTAVAVAVAAAPTPFPPRLYSTAPPISDPGTARSSSNVLWRTRVVA